MNRRPAASRRRHIPFVAILPIVALVVPLVACGRRDATTSPAPASPSTRPVRVGHFPNLTHAPALLARSRGELEKAMAPRPVEWRMFTAGPSAVEAIFAGELDLAWIGPGPAVNGFVKSKGASLRVLAGAVAGGAGLVARDGSGITSAADLSGRRVATPQAGNTQDIALRSFLVARHLDWTERGGTVRVLPLPPADQLTLFRKGDLDAAWAVEPWLSRLVLEGRGTLVVDETTLWPSGRFPTTLFVARKGFLDESPELAARAAEVNRAAVERLASGDPAARAEVEAILATLAGGAMPRAVLDAAWSRLVFTTDPMPDALRKGADDAGKLGFLPTSVDLASLVARLPAGSR